MTKADSKLTRLEKEVTAAQPNQDLITVDWTPEQGNQSIKERAKEKALKSGQVETFIEWGENDQIIAYTYDPKLNRGWYS